MTRLSHNLKNGQTLVTLLFFMIIGLTITVAAAIILVNTFSSVTNWEQGSTAYSIAETGAEEAILRLLRNPSYNGETLPIDDGNATISITPGDPIVISSIGIFRKSTREIEVKLVYQQNLLTISSWKEIF